MLSERKERKEEVCIQNDEFLLAVTEVKAGEVCKNEKKKRIGKYVQPNMKHILSLFNGSLRFKIVVISTVFISINASMHEVFVLCCRL
jgi:hypothetical protein